MEPRGQVELQVRQVIPRRVEVAMEELAALVEEVALGAVVVMADTVPVVPVGQSKL